MKQLLDWVYQKNVYDFDEMTNLSKKLRELLKERFEINLPKIHFKQKTADSKTIKLKLGLKDEKEVEAVFMKEQRHATICISTQVGCAQACVFCATGKMGVIRNLTAGEIVGQFLAFRQLLGDKLGESIRIVYMGMGEPFHNQNQVFKSLEIFTSPEAVGIGSRKITISTSGVVKGIYRLMNEFPKVQLAISLHTVEQNLRKQWIPNQKESVQEILDAAREFTKSTGRKITFEMVLFGGKGMQTARLNKLGKQIKGIHCNVNGIPYNPIEGLGDDFIRPTHEEINHFKEILSKWQNEVTVRISRGREIQAACGQLIINTPA